MSETFTSVVFAGLDLYICKQHDSSSILNYIRHLLSIRRWPPGMYNLASQNDPECCNTVGFLQIFQPKCSRLPLLLSLLCLPVAALTEYTTLRLAFKEAKGMTDNIITLLAY